MTTQITLTPLAQDVKKHLQLRTEGGWQNGDPIGVKGTDADTFFHARHNIVVDCNSLAEPVNPRLVDTSSRAGAARLAGFSLVQVWEDDWQRGRHAVLSGIRHLMPSESPVATGITDDHLLVGAIKDDPINTVHLSPLRAARVVGITENWTTDGVGNGVFVGFAQYTVSSGSTPVITLLRYSELHHVPGMVQKMLDYFKKTYDASEVKISLDYGITDSVLEGAGFVRDGSVDTGRYADIKQGRTAWVYDAQRYYRRWTFPKGVNGWHFLPRVCEPGKITLRRAI